jgi:hypothetical protein
VRSALSSRRRSRLIRQLRTAHDSLGAWDMSLRQAVAVPGNFSPKDAAALLAVFDEAKRDINRRLAELGEAPVSEPAAAPVASRRVKVPAEGLLLSAACRACGRALGAAFREAQAVADAATARIVYGPLRALEKQMWFLDSLQSH